MPFDSTVMGAVVAELNERLLGGRISKIYQPEPDELALLCYSAGANYRLLLSANARHARLHLTAIEKKNPPAPPTFCMLLRKYIEGGHITAIQQVGRDRICRITIGVTDELGNPVEFVLTAEVMGKHSNIVLLNPQGRIVDAIRRVSEEVNRYRELLPGLPYIAPPPTAKLDPATLTPPVLAEAMAQRAGAAGEAKGAAAQAEAATGQARGAAAQAKVATGQARGAAAQAKVVTGQAKGAAAQAEVAPGQAIGLAWQLLLDLVDGLGPMLAKEAIARAGYPVDLPAGQAEPARLVAAVQELAAPQGYDPRLLYDERGRLKEYHVLELTHWPGRWQGDFASVSACLDAYYGGRADEERFGALRGSLAKLVRDEAGRVRKKLKAQRESLETAENAEDYRIRGELITANLWQIKKGETEVSLPNYYEPDAAPLQVTLDPQLSPSENAQAYYRRYQKARSGLAMIREQVAKSEAELTYLEQVEQSLEEASSLPDLEEVHRELTAEGYIAERSASRDRRKHLGKGAKAPHGRRGQRGPGWSTGSNGSNGFNGSNGSNGSSGSNGSNGSRRPNGPSGSGGPGEQRAAPPLTIQSSDGLQIWVGRNNRQNDYLTLKLAAPNDLWFHTKNIPGSHVILRPAPGREVPERAIHEAAALAAYHSRARNSSGVPVDYTLRKHVRKPHGARPGMVIYDNQKTLWVTPDPELVPILKGGQDWHDRRTGKDHHDRGDGDS